MKNILTIILTLFVLTSFGQTAPGYTTITSEYKTLERRDTIAVKIDTTIDFVFVVDSSGFVKRKKVWRVEYKEIYETGVLYTYTPKRFPEPIYLDFDTKKEIKKEDIF